MVNKISQDKKIKQILKNKKLQALIVKEILPELSGLSLDEIVPMIQERNTEYLDNDCRDIFMDAKLEISGKSEKPKAYIDIEPEGREYPRILFQKPCYQICRTYV
ncbi:MAG: hypothetical protein J6D36_05880 [Erysipelotrichaceae bacterium]|nr:hypothetical protein [Erysipelotrichaceae bacterium]